MSFNKKTLCSRACMYSHLIHNFAFWSQYIWHKTGAVLSNLNITICVPSFAILNFSQKCSSLWPLAFVCPPLIPSSCVGLRNSRWNIWRKHTAKRNLLGGEKNSSWHFSAPQFRYVNMATSPYHITWLITVRWQVTCVWRHVVERLVLLRQNCATLPNPKMNKVPFTCLS